MAMSMFAVAQLFVAWKLIRGAVEAAKGLRKLLKATVVFGVCSWPMSWCNDWRMCGLSAGVRLRRT